MIGGIIVIIVIIIVFVVRRRLFEVGRKRRRDKYLTYLKSEAWQRKRYVVLKRDQGRCVYCGARATQVHHKKYAKYNIGSEPIDWLVSICKPCHEAQHGRRTNNEQQSKTMIFRQANFSDTKELKYLAIKSWSVFKSQLTTENWGKLYNSLTSDETYKELLEKSTSILYIDDNKSIIGMAFLIPSGNPTDICQADWSYIRFLTVDPAYQGKGIGKQLTLKCIDIAKANKESAIALHTSELMNNARHIYESLGFNVVREIEPRLGKKYWLYKLDL